MSAARLLTGCLAALLVSSLQAREPLYGIHGNADLLACEEAHWSGEQETAQRCYRNLLAVTQPALIRAEALWALGDLQGANGMFQQAQNAEPESPLVRIRWG
ncbi:MAG TPA: hypothetical protein GX696_01600, partial [Pseudomonadaceae bacterium]|nr:hypothetical protein [Pseudomonadaceae bacterium]